MTSCSAAIGRSGAQCSLRYRLSLNPKLKWRLWSPLEDRQLVSLREESGYNWAMIAATMERAGPSCRYRYLKIKREEAAKTAPMPSSEDGILGR